MSRQAQAEAQAQAQQRAEALIQAMDWTCRALSQLRHYREARDKQRKKQHAKGHVWRPAPNDDRLERGYLLMLMLTLGRWEGLLAEEEAER